MRLKHLLKWVELYLVYVGNNGGLLQQFILGAV